MCNNGHHSCMYVTRPSEIQLLIVDDSIYHKVFKRKLLLENLVFWSCLSVSLFRRSLPFRISFVDVFSMHPHNFPLAQKSINRSLRT